ncbi:14924_t:CDS:2 [Funneliformis mosseae]|uniref:14924_t:CDS:1 n=1 Tax=Funneliformis mosseae TaxID=27381 RepID=A0A9N8VMZ3_FUNMO|nr:14924_t:CDS:2 [Funneliformis mosseae]
MSTSTTTDPSVEDMERFNTEQLIDFLRTKNLLSLNDIVYKKIRDERVASLDFLQLTREILRLLSQEQVFSCIPPPLTLRPNAVKRISTMNSNSGDFKPVVLLPWERFLEEVNNFKFSNQPEYNRPQLIDYSQMHNEINVQIAFETNICVVLNKLLKDYDISRDTTKNPGELDFIVHFVSFQVLITIKVKRKHVLEDIGEQSFIEFHKHDSKAQSVIRLIYSYMVVNQVKYGVLSTYDNHWFLRRLDDNEENGENL